jgi:hypothetical protein
VSARVLLPTTRDPFGDAEPPLETSGEGTRAKQAPAGRQLEPGVFEALGKRESFLAIAKRLLWRAVTRQRPHVGGAQEREGSKITPPSGEVLPGGIKNPRFFLGKPGFCATKEAQASAKVQIGRLEGVQPE